MATIKPVPGVPFRDQSPEFRFQEHVSRVAGFALAGPSDLSLTAKVDWFTEVAITYDAAMRPAVREAVLQRLCAEGHLK